MDNGNEAPGTAVVVRASETRSIAASLKAAIPSWIKPADLDSCFPHGLGVPMPDGAGTELRAASDAFTAAMAPSKSEERQAVLLGMRNSTIIRRESEEEAGASLDMLRAHLEDVPLDILQTACRAYCNAAGQRFFPKSAGELRVFINPLIFERRGSAFRLSWLADRADAEERERQRLAEDPADPAEVRKLLEGMGFKAAAAEPREPLFIPRGPSVLNAKAGPRVPTIDDYAEILGVDRETAQRIMDEDAAGMGEGVQIGAEGEAKRDEAA